MKSKGRREVLLAIHPDRKQRLNFAVRFFARGLRPLAAARLVLPVLIASFGFELPAWSLVGDVDRNGIVDARDADAIADHVIGKTSLTGASFFEADVNRDGVVDAADVVALSFLPSKLSSSSPANFEGDVSVTRETILRFSRPLDPASVTPDAIFAEFGGNLILATPHVSPDRYAVTLFYDPILPASARVRVSVIGDFLRDDRGIAVDADGDGLAGGTGTVDFDTLSLTSFPGTTVSGRVFASELVAGSGNTTESLNLPLAGVRISVAGADSEIFAITDSMGNFSLQNAPAGRFFVHIDGRVVTTAIIDGNKVATHYPQGPYFPFVGKAWTPIPGHAVNIGDIFLPLILPGTLQPVSADQETNITFAPEVLQKNPGLAGVAITVPANSLFSDSGAQGGMVGIAPVAPDRIPGPLPEGLEFPLVITVQTNGPSNFDIPVPACFPNLPDPATHIPLAPGTKNFLYSFNHDKGVWGAVGSMTVSANGLLICTDPGVGIQAPGWHGTGPPPYSPPEPTCGAGPESTQALGSGKGDHGSPSPQRIPRISIPPIPICTPKPKPPPSKLEQCLDACESKAEKKRIEKLQIYFAYERACEQYTTQEAVSDCIRRAQDGWREIEQKITDRLIECINKCATTHSLSSASSPMGGPGKLGVESVVDQLIQLEAQITDILQPYALSRADIPGTVLAQVAGILDQADQVAGGDAVAFIRNRVVELEGLEDLNPFADPFDFESDNAPDNPVLYAARILRPSGPMDLRGETGPRGEYTLFIPRDGELISVSFFDPRSYTWGVIQPNLRSEAQFELPRFVLGAIDNTFLDFDGDELVDFVEFVYGTDPENPDSDGDGVFDFAELDQGTNPLDGLPAITGVIASVDTPGEALNISTVNNLAVVADGVSGVSVFNVFSGMNPTIIAQVDTPGTAQAVAISGKSIAVADGALGLAIINISDPPAAAITRQLNFGAAVQTVAADGGLAYAGLTNGQIVVVDLQRGYVLARSQVPAAVQDLFLAGDHIYALTSTTLYVLSYSGGILSITGSVVSPSVSTPNTRLAVGGGIAYAVHGKGYNTFNINNPAAPELIAAGNTTQFGWKQMALNGSGLGVAATGPNFAGVINVELYDVSDPLQTDVPLTQFITPGFAHAVSIFDALAYDADGTAGIQVINYRPYDALHIAPTINLFASFSLSPAQVEEGKLVRVTASVADDVQVRNVEFSVNGEVAFTDGNFPFEYRFITPRRSQGTSFILQARVSDTGGNFTFTDLITVNLLPDITAPTVLAVSPAANSPTAPLQTITAFFNEPIGAASLNPSGFQIYSAGVDALLNTPDDTLLTGGTLSTLNPVNGVLLTFAQPLSPGYHRGSINAPLADIAGNVLQGIFNWNFYVFSGADADGDNIPDSIEASLGLNSGNPNSDGDTFLDGDEDFDADGLANAAEIFYGTDPTDPDTDNDFLNDGGEISAGTNPFEPYTDGDGFLDGEEVLYGSDPANTQSIPNAVNPSPGEADGVIFSILNSIDPTDTTHGEADQATFSTLNTIDPTDTSHGEADQATFSVLNQ